MDDKTYKDGVRRGVQIALHHVNFILTTCGGSSQFRHRLEFVRRLISRAINADTIARWEGISDYTPDLLKTLFSQGAPDGANSHTDIAILDDIVSDIEEPKPDPRSN